MFDALKDFLRLETAAGTILVGTAVLAMIVANSPIAGWYDQLISLPIAVQIGTFEIAKPMLLWINDGLMAIFFLMVGLELKREVFQGELSDTRQVIFPAFAAVGGMLVPSLIFAWLNWEDSVALQGWAIPAATDIAFALAVLALLGSRVPLSLRVFLVTVAIFDDIGAIVIIALFYSEDLSLTSLIIALVCLVPLYVLNRRGVTERSPYLFIGAIMWVALLKSGVHATLAGVVLAWFIPIRDRSETRSPLHELEHDLHTLVAFGVLPIFAFANAGLPLGGLALSDLLHPVPLGVMLGLFVGKQIGVMGFCALCRLLKLSVLPPGLTWRHVYGASLLCGIGFTMSLFIGSLAFETTAEGIEMLFDERLGIMVGSLLSAAGGFLLLRWALPKEAAAET